MAREKIGFNFLDRVVSYVSPVTGLRRMAARQILGQYEAAKSTRLRRKSRDARSANAQVQQGAVALRLLARNLEQNHDIARGALRVLVNNVIGPAGIGIEPQPRRKDGRIHEEYANALRVAFLDWQRKPEVTQQHHWSKVQRLVARTWLRDGECFSQRLFGGVPLLDHGTRVPYSLELLEPDMVPLDYQDQAKGVQQGLELNAWGKVTGYWVYKAYPGGDVWTSQSYAMKRIDADHMHHIKSVDRIGQARGASEFASVITRLEDIKDYEESERIAAKVAASMTAFIKKGAPDSYPPASEIGESGARELTMAPGMIFDDLRPGEDIGMIDSNRPNPNLIHFRQGQLRAVAAGIGASYSSVARDYNGTYSAQRQELVEQWIHYAVMTDDFVGQFVQPVWQDFVRTADLSRVVPRPADVDPATADDALFIGQSMPWIDPLKESSAWRSLVQDGFASEVEVIRKRGGSPRDTLDQIKRWRDECASAGLVFGSNFANQAAAKTDAAGAQPAPGSPAD